MKDDVTRVANGGQLSYPLVVELDITTFCDLRCPECISRSLLNSTKLSGETVTELIAEIAESPIKAIILIGGGEPLAHPKFGYIVDRLWSSGKKIGVTTNGTMLRHELQTLAQKTDWVRVSLDAASQDCYDLFRPSRAKKSKFNAVMDNIVKLCSIKTGLVGVSYLLMFRSAGSVSGFCDNYTELYRAGQLAKALGCDYFEVRLLCDDHHRFVMPHDRLRVSLLTGIERLYSLTDKHFQVLFPSSFTSFLSGEGSPEIKHYKKCFISELRTLITPSGVYLCPYFRGNPKKKIGDITRGSLRAIWSGEQRKSVMGKTDPSCECDFHCIRHKSNELLANPQSIVNLPAIDDFDLFL